MQLSAAISEGLGAGVGEREQRGGTREEKKGLLVQGIPMRSLEDFSVEQESLRPRPKEPGGQGVPS